MERLRGFFTYRSYNNLDLNSYGQLLSLILKLTMLYTDSNIFFKLILDNLWLTHLLLKLIRRSIIIKSIIDWNLANQNYYIYCETTIYILWKYTLTKLKLSIILESMNSISIVRTRLDAK